MVFDGKTARLILYSLISAGCICYAATSDSHNTSQIDKSKYITVDEIKPGMDAYCLTVYEGTKIEKFNLKVLDVVYNIMPGRDAILVQGTDERFVHTGPVGGCSGSPVFIEGRLAGALAFGWIFSKDPLYGVTPIQEMLQVKNAKVSEIRDMGSESLAVTFDFSKPIDFNDINKRFKNCLSGLNKAPAGVKYLPCTLVSSALPSEAYEQIQSLAEYLGFESVAGAGSTINTNADEELNLARGSCLSVPLATGDISLSAIGTVTEVVNDEVYGFGHSFLGFGPIELPMATGKVHTVVSNLFRSFKFSSTLNVVGALTIDESAAVYGRIGTKAKMIPVTIDVDHCYDTIKRQYNCQLAYNRLLTPMIAPYLLYGAALMAGNVPLDHMIDYKVSVYLQDAEPITYQNVSTNVGLGEIMQETMGILVLLMNNPYENVDIQSIKADINIRPKNIGSHIWSVRLSDSELKAGEKTDIEVIIEPFRDVKKKYNFALTIPQELPPGKYQLMVCGAAGYQQFLRANMPYKFIAQNSKDMMDAINNILKLRRDRLYCILELPPGGITLEKSELPDLPATKAVILQDIKRPLKIQPYPHWIEKACSIDTVVVDQQTISITVVKQ